MAPSWWRRWLKRILWSILLIGGMTACKEIFKHHQNQKGLEQTLAELDRSDPGWRLTDIEAARETFPEASNSARTVVAAAELLPKGWPPTSFAQQLEDVPDQERLGPEQLGLLEQEMNRVRSALQEARKLADMPGGHHKIEYKQWVLDTVLADQQKTRQVVWLLFYDSLWQAQQQHLSAALRSCRACLNGARSLGDEPNAISQLIRTSGTIHVCQAIVRTLALGEASRDALADLQNLLHQEDSFADLEVTARGERAMQHETFRVMESGEVPLSKLSGKPSDWEDYAYGWITRKQFLQAHPTMLELMGRWVSITLLPSHEQEATEKELGEDLRRYKQAEPIAVLFLPGFDKLAGASRRKHAYLRCAQAALAAERYRLAKGKWPASLEVLCPVFLPAVPLDPFDGQPLRYQRLADGVRIYSVGKDRTDNGGKLDPKHPQQSGVDVGYRLWDVSQRRQPPRPREKAPVHR